MYAAGIAVLFLLFSSTGNAAALLEEAESGTLDRILVSKAGLFHIVTGKWLGILLLGCLQITVMFVWAEMIFRIQLVEASVWILRHDVQHGRRHRQLCDAAGDIVQVPSTTECGFGCDHSEHVGRRRQHDSSFCHERSHEGNRQMDIQCLGSGWLSESLLVSVARLQSARRSRRVAGQCIDPGCADVDVFRTLEARVILRVSS